jgi:hypothetical protein
MTYSIRLPKGFVIAFLASIYIFGFIITPYWILHKSMIEVIFYLALTISIGIIWVLLSTNSLQVEFSLKDIKLFLLLLVGIVVLNYRPLNSVIPFRGDETLHIERTLDVVNRLPPLQSLVIMVLFIAFMIFGIREQKWAFFVGMVIVICVVFYFLGENLFKDMERYPQFFLRYPFINYWFFAVIPKLASLISSPYHEILYRIIPLLSMVGTAWIVQKKSGVSSLLDGAAWGFAVATIPLIFYYSSILYIEPPAVFLMTVACFDINNLMHNSSKDISKTPSWYALILIGFIKETTTPFLFCFMVIRIVIQIRTWFKKRFNGSPEKTLLSLLAGELGIVFVLLAPAFLYLYFRATLTTTRSFIPQPSNLYDLTNYRFVILSYMEQFGPFLFFFIAGCVLLIVNRQFTAVFCYLILILAIPAFHIMGNPPLK